MPANGDLLDGVLRLPLLRQPRCGHLAHSHFHSTSGLRSRSRRCAGILSDHPPIESTLVSGHGNLSASTAWSITRAKFRALPRTILVLPARTRSSIPTSDLSDGDLNWRDLNSKYVLMIWRDYVLTGSNDEAFLRDSWPADEAGMDTTIDNTTPTATASSNSDFQIEPTTST